VEELLNEDPTPATASDDSLEAPEQECDVEEIYYEPSIELADDAIFSQRRNSQRARFILEKAQAIT